MRFNLTAKNSIDGKILTIRDYEVEEKFSPSIYAESLWSEMKLNSELKDWRINDHPVTEILADEEGHLSFSVGDRLANSEEVGLEDRCVGSIWEALEPNEILLLADGLVILDDELNMSPLIN